MSDFERSSEKNQVNWHLAEAYPTSSPVMREPLAQIIHADGGLAQDGG